MSDYTAPVSSRVHLEQSQQADIQKTVRQIIQQYRSAGERVERREEDRIHFVQPVKVRTESQREYTLLALDLSSTGICLIGTHRFLGQKVRVSIPASDGTTCWDFVVRILWTCPVGEGLFENGGTLLALADAAKEQEGTRPSGGE